MPLTSPGNQRPLAFLAARGPGAVALQGLDDMANRYVRCGCHPDIVERIWDVIGRALNMDARRIVYGTPCLVLPRSLLIIAEAVGTQYAVRVPARVTTSKDFTPRNTRAAWSSGDTMDTTASLGADWVFGAWSADEVQWALDFAQLHEH